MIFHIVSYLQYPLMIGSMYFYVPFIVSLFNNQPEWSNFNFVLILFGVALSFSTLQDTAKTQNKLSRKIWENPTKGRISLVVISLTAFSLVAIGLLTFYFSKGEVLESISIGITVLGIGLMGLLKSAIEMFENHRKDKNTIVETSVPEDV